MLPSADSVAPAVAAQLAATLPPCPAAASSFLRMAYRGHPSASSTSSPGALAAAVRALQGCELATRIFVKRVRSGVLETKVFDVDAQDTWQKIRNDIIEYARTRSGSKMHLAVIEESELNEEQLEALADKEEEDVNWKRLSLATLADAVQRERARFLELLAERGQMPEPMAEMPGIDAAAAEDLEVRRGRNDAAAAEDPEVRPGNDAAAAKDPEVRRVRPRLG